MKTQTKGKPILLVCLVLACGCFFLVSAPASGTPTEEHELTPFDEGPASSLKFVERAEGLHGRFLHDLGLLTRVQGLGFHGVHGICRVVGDEPSKGAGDDGQSVIDEDDDAYDELGGPNPLSETIKSVWTVLYALYGNGSDTMNWVNDVVKEMPSSTMGMYRLINKIRAVCDDLEGQEGLLAESVSLLGSELDAYCRSGVGGIMKGHNFVDAPYLKAFDGETCPNSTSRATPRGRDPASWERLRLLMRVHSL